jgi:8-oxo-dGTP diphosphatase
VVVRILAAGGLVWRDGSRREILIVHRHRYDDWTLPKGKLEPGETFVGCALREIEEETGHAVRLESWAGETCYEVEGRPKSVLFWNVLPTGAAPGPVDPDEVAEVVWLPVDAALERLVHADERELVRRNRGLPPPG